MYDFTAMYVATYVCTIISLYVTPEATVYTYLHYNLNTLLVYNSCQYHGLHLNIRSGWGAEHTQTAV